MKNEKDQQLQQLALKNEALEKKIKTQALELETWKKEAQIEAALERVRAASMAMHKSEELANVALVTLSQLEGLGVPQFANTINIIDRATKEYVMYVAYDAKEFEEKQIMISQSLPKDSAQFSSDIWDLHEEGLHDYSYELKEDTLKEWASHIKNYVNQERGEILENLDYERIFFHGANFNGYSDLIISSLNPLSENHRTILKRMADTFSMSYTRFLDLQKAEEQAREAQIEAALERVRAASMAMHKTEELAGVVTTLFNQFQVLEVDILLAFIGIYHIEEKFVHQWFSPIKGIKEDSFFIRLPTAPWEETTIKDWKAGKEMAFESTQGTEAVLQYAKAIDAIANLDLFENMVKKLSIDTIEQTEANHKYGNLSIVQQRKATSEEIAILKRFSKVFEQTYTRFLDLQKAEAQAKQLEIVFNENQRLLHSILPEPIAEQIRTGQQNVVKRFDQVSILFADIVGFTHLSEKANPQEVVDILNNLFSKFDDLTDEFHLEKIKTIGDAYMVAAGVPEEMDNHAKTIFLFAKKMLEIVKSFEYSLGSNLQIRIGISSGPVVAGVIGKKKFAYDLWGDTVNTAARMEAYGQGNCIQVSPTTYKLLKDDFSFEKIKNMKIKGKGKMNVYLWNGD